MKMKITRIVLLALMVVSAGVFTSCKDYDEDNYNNILSEQKSIQKTLQSEIDALQQALNSITTCGCSTKGYVTINDVASYLKDNGYCKDLSGYYTRDEVKTLVGDSLKKYVTDAELAAAVANANDSIEKAKQALNGTITEQGKAINTLQQQMVYVIALAKQDSIDISNIKAELPLLSDSLKNAYDSIASLRAQANTTYALALANQDAIAKKADQQALVDSTKAARDYAYELFSSLKTTVDNEIARVDSIETATNDSVSALRTDISALQQAIANLNIPADWTEAVQQLKDKIAGYDKAISELTDKVNDLIDARAKQITGIIVQGIYNPNIININTPFGLNTNLFLVYYGEANGLVEFPSSDPQYTALSGDVLMNEGEGNAGKIYVTINPNDINFDGFKDLILVNSQDKESAVKIGEVIKSDELLQFGASRMADNGFYEATATIKPSDITDESLKVNLNKSSFKSAFEDILNASSVSEIKTTAKSFADAALTTIYNMKLDAQGLKCTWADSLGTHSVYSNYGIAAVAAKPLGFNAADSYFPRTSIPGYNKASDFIDRMFNKVCTEIDNMIGDSQTNLDKHGIVSVESNGTSFDVVISYNGDADVKTTLETANAALIAAGKPARITKIDTDKKQITLTYTVSDINDILDAIDMATLCDMVQDLLDQINTLEAKIQTGGEYYNKIHEYLDKINTKALNAVNKLPLLLKPVLVVNSDLGICRAGVAGSPCAAKGEVELIPTTYNAELITPIFKKYIKIDDQAGEILTTNSKTVTLSAGVHKVTYAALDYYGNEISADYYINVE